jgi:hypothetical protein
MCAKSFGVETSSRAANLEYRLGSRLKTIPLNVGYEDLKLEGTDSRIFSNKISISTNFGSDNPRFS